VRFKASNTESKSSSQRSINSLAIVGVILSFTATVTMSSPPDSSTQATSQTTTVVLFGKIGHGKTCLLNKICQASFDSHMSSQSCTRTLQRGKSIHYGMNVVDTPGFYATEDVEHHTLCQIQALAQTGELSGIYVVVKYARCSDMAETVNKVMDFVGDDGEEYIRVIVTHVDTVEKQEFNAAETKADLAHLLDMPLHHITLTGNAKHDGMTTDSNSNTSRHVEEFIHTTLHPRPRAFQVSNEQLGCISNLCVGARKFNQAIEDVNGKIKAATVACQTLMVSSSLLPLSRSGDGTFDLTSCCSLCCHGAFAIHVTRQATKSMVHDARDQLNLQGGRELTPEELKILSGKLDVLLSVSLESFLIQTALKRGSFDSKRRHLYPSLDIMYRKVVIKDDDEWEGVYHVNGEETPASNVTMMLKESYLKQTTLQEKIRKSQDGNQKAKRQKTSDVLIVDNLSSVGDSNIQNPPGDDHGLEEISPCSELTVSPSRQKKPSCSSPRSDSANNQELPVPACSYCILLVLLFSFLFILGKVR
jgi:GTP-binding protein EngB required for normal cell division